MSRYVFFFMCLLIIGCSDATRDAIKLSFIEFGNDIERVWNDIADKTGEKFDEIQNKSSQRVIEYLKEKGYIVEYEKKDLLQRFLFC